MSGMRKDDDMRILISNDDGIFAPGLMALVRAFSAAGHTVYVAAPTVPEYSTSEPAL